MLCKPFDLHVSFSVADLLMNVLGFFFNMPLWLLFLGSPITVDSAPFGLPLLTIFGGILICATVTIIKKYMLIIHSLKLMDLQVDDVSTV